MYFEWKKIDNIDFVHKLKKIQTPIRRWNNESFGNMDYMIRKMEEEIKRLDDIGMSKDLDEVDLARRRVLIAQMEKWLN